MRHLPSIKASFLYSLKNIWLPEEKMQDQTDATENHISMPKEYEGKLTDSIE